jgi:hypothetical protein
MGCRGAGRLCRFDLHRLASQVWEMTTHQCFFFADGRVGDWENIETETNTSLARLLARRLGNGEWDYIEAWFNDELVCVVHRNRADTSGRLESALGF